MTQSDDDTRQLLADLDAFRDQCEAAEYTDTGDAWSMIDRLESALRGVSTASTAEKDVELRVTREDAENLVSGLYAFMPSCTDELVDDLRELVEYIGRRVTSPGESCLCRDPLREVHAGCPLHGHSPESVFPPGGGDT